MNQSASLPVHGSEAVTGASRGIGRAVRARVGRSAASTRSLPCATAAGASMPEEAKGSLEVRRARRDRPLRRSSCPVICAVRQQRRHRRRLPARRARQHRGLATPLRDRMCSGVVALTSVAIPVRRGPTLRRGVHGQLVLDLRVGPFYAAYRHRRPRSRRSMTACHRGGPFGIRVVEFLPGPVETRHVRPVRANTTPPVSSIYPSLGRRRPAAQGMPILGWSAQPMPPSPSSTPSSRVTVRCATAATPSPTSCSSCGATMTTRRWTSA